MNSNDMDALFRFIKGAALLMTVAVFRCTSVEGVKVIGNDTTVIQGENATLFSQLTETDESLTRIRWHKKTRENPEEKLFFMIHPDGKTEHLNGLGERVKFIGNFAEKNGSIQLERMRLLDEGIYTCIFNLFPSGPFETYINVTVVVPPVVKIIGEAPVSGLKEVPLASCFASHARPAAEVSWRLGALNNSLRTQTNHTVHSNGTVTVVSYLVGEPSKHLNHEKVQCLIKHITLTEELEYTINIHYPPESVTIIPDNPTKAKEFRCEVDANPSPDYTWSKVNETPFHSDGDKLVFSKLSPEFNGLYICHASNQYGSSSGSMYVYVHTESSRACWGLFGFVFIFAVGLIIFVGYKWWQNLRSEQAEVPNEEQEQEELQSRVDD